MCMLTTQKLLAVGFNFRWKKPLRQQFKVSQRRSWMVGTHDQSLWRKRRKSSGMLEVLVLNCTVSESKMCTCVCLCIGMKVSRFQIKSTTLHFGIIKWQHGQAITITFSLLDFTIVLLSQSHYVTVWHINECLTRRSVNFLFPLADIVPQLGSHVLGVKWPLLMKYHTPTAD